MVHISQEAMKQLFDDARTHSYWLPKPVEKALLQQLYDLMKYGPTSANCCPLRIVFVTSEQGKEKLKPALAEGNVDKTMNAPVCAILAMDMAFYTKLPELFPHTDAKSWFAGNNTLIEETAFRNSSLQAAYFILAARAVGLDCGPMSGFDKEKINNIFFAGTEYKVNMLCNLGYGDATKLHTRSPRLRFDDVCWVE